MLRDVSDISVSTTVLGRELTMPVLLAPVGLAGMFARRAEVQAARAAERFGVPFCESTVSICGIDEVAAATTAPFWYQLYVMRDRSYAEGLMAQADRCGVRRAGADRRLPRGRRALPRHPQRHDRAGRPARVASSRASTWCATSAGCATSPSAASRSPSATWSEPCRARPHPRTFKAWVDAQFDPSVTWDDLAWVREHWAGKVVLKGVLDPEDARRAVDEGVDAVVVSNHGGRQLDDTTSTVRALPAVVDAVGGRTEVLVDGGIRSGLDVVKMLALGARACLIGRPWAWAVAGGGEAGVTQVLETIHQELLVAMALCGATDVATLEPSVLLER